MPRKGCCFQKWVLPYDHSSTVGEPLTLISLISSSLMLRRKEPSQIRSASLSSEPNCPLELSSARIMFLTDRPLALPKAETVLKSNLYFYQNECSDPFILIFLWAWLQYSWCFIWNRIFFVYLMLCTFQMYSLKAIRTEYLPCVRTKCGQVVPSLEGVNALHFVTHATRAPGTWKEAQKGFLAKATFASLTVFCKADFDGLFDPQVLGNMEQMELQNHTASSTPSNSVTLG